MVEVHMTTNIGSDVSAGDEQCKTIGKAELKLAEVVHYPSNKLHGSVLINSCPTSGWCKMTINFNCQYYN